RRALAVASVVEAFRPADLAGRAADRAGWAAGASGPDGQRTAPRRRRAQDRLPPGEARPMSYERQPDRKPRWGVWLPLALFAVFVALALLMLVRPADREVTSAMIGKPLPQFALRPAIAERPGLATGDFAAGGKPRLLNVF